MITKNCLIGIIAFLITLFTVNTEAQTMNITSDDISCVVGQGRIIVSVSTGTGPYDYYLFDGDPFGGGNLLDSELNTMSTSHTFADWTAATYWVGLTSGEGSIAQPFVLSTVQDEALSVPTITVDLGPTCINSHDGILSASVTGGNPPYSYSWAPGGQTTQTITGVGQGTYRVTVNDSYNCGLSNERVLFFYYGVHDSIPDSLNAGQIGGTQQICSGGNPTTLTNVTAPSGGSGSYTYSWEYQSNCAGGWTLIPGATGSSYDPPGPLSETRCYKRIITNTCGVMESNTVTVTVESLPSQYNVSGTNTICAGTSTNIDLSDSDIGVTYELYLGGAPTGNTVAGTGNPISWSVSAAGTYTVEGVNDAGLNCSQFMIGNAVITTEALPTQYNVSGTIAICDGGSTNIDLSDSDVGVTYELFLGGAPTGNTIAGTGNPISWSVSAAGTYTVEGVNDAGLNCSQFMNGSAIVTVELLPTQYNVTGTNTICDGSSTNIDLSDSDVGVTYELFLGGAPTGNTIAGTGNPISWSVTSAGTYTVEGVNNGGISCSQMMNGSAIITTEALPNQYNVSGTITICDGSSTNIDLSDSDVGVTYELYLGGAPTGNTIAGTGNPISWTVSASGTYTVEGVNDAGLNCAQFMNGSAVVSIELLPTQYNVTGTTTICNGDNTSIDLSDSDVGVTYELIFNGTPTGNTIAGTGNPISWTGVSAAGTYTVQGVNDGGLNCSQFMNGSAIVTIEPLPAQYNVSGTNTICDGSNTNIDLSDSDVGVTYELYLGGAPTGNTIAGTGNPISWNVSAAGTYTVEGVNNGGIGCSQFMNGNAVVTVELLPTQYNVTGTNTICNGSSTNIDLSDSDVGVTYELFLGGAPTGNTIAGTGNPISWSVSAAGTYTVEGVNNAGLNCSQFMNGSATITIEPLPTQYNVSGTNTICEGSSTSIDLSDSDVGVTYELYLGGSPTGNTIAGSGNPISWTVSVAGTYTVEGVNDAGENCSQFMNGSATVTVELLPVQYNVTGTNTICDGSNTNINLSDSDVGVTYELYLGGAPTGNTIAGTGNPISWVVSAAGTYTVEGVNNAGLNCAQFMNGSAIVTVELLPTQYNVSGTTTICDGSSTNIDLSDSDIGVTYELYLGGAPTGNTIAGTGNPISWTVSAAGTYTVEGVNNAGLNCSQFMNGSATITIELLPTQYDVSGTNSICDGSSTNIDLSDSDVGVTYELYLGGAPTGNTIAGTGNPISWSVSAAGTYTVEGVNDAGLNCAQFMNGSAVVSIELPPTQYNVTGTATICDGSSTNIDLSDSDVGVTYELYLGGAPTGNTIAGTGNPISWTVSAAGTYTVEGVNNAGLNCSQFMNGNAVITIEPLPTQYDVSGTISICDGDNTSIDLSDSDIGVTYELFLNGSPTGNTIAGTGNPISWNVTAAGTYTVEAVNDAGLNCSQFMNGSAIITVNPLPTIFNVTGGGSYCFGGSGLPVGLDGSQSGVDYELILNGTPTGNIIGGSGSAISFGDQTLAGTYTVEATNATTFCQNNMAGSVDIVINSLPNANVLPKNANTCQDQGLLYNGTPTGGTAPYSHAWTGSGSTYLDATDIVSPTFTSPVDGIYRLIYTVTDDNGCTDIDSTDVTVIPAPIIEAGPDATICNGDTIHITGASVLNVLDFSWRSSGTGTFDDADLIDPVYTPSITDRQNGTVTLYLDAIGNAPCFNVTDSFELTIPPPVQPVIGAPAPFLIGVNTEIEVCLATSGHQFIVDMGYYLTAPDGSTVLPLKMGPMEFDFFNPCPLFPPPPGDVDTICFTTELPLSDTVDICTEPRPINGTFAATGDWSMIYGMNPAEGGWAVMIKDTANNMGGVDGNIVFASLSFVDTATATGLLQTIDYYSNTVSIPILEPANTSYIIPRGLRESCPGACDAVGIVNVLGGTPPYVNYNWSPAPAGGNGADSVLLCEGTYNLTVTDALGCEGTTSVDVISPPEIDIDAVNYTDTIGCYGDTTGIISVQASGGTGSLTFTLLPSTPSETADSGYFSGLGAGTYTIRIEDSKGCYKDTTVSIYQREQLVLESAVVTDSVFCAGDNNGRIVATASGGTSPYEFILEPVNVINDSGIFENLAPGSYVVRLTDANSCDTIDSDTLILGVPVPLTIETVIISPIICNGDLGSLTVVASGGKKPYSVSILGGAGAIPDQGDTTVFSNLAPDDYDVVVTDANGCTATWGTITLTDPPALILNSLIITPITTCYDDPVGEILVNVTGGVPPVEYSIDGINYQASNLISGLTGGDYTVYYRDGNGCVQSKDTTMVSPPILEGNPTITHIQVDGYGSVEFAPSGGTPFTIGEGYRYSIDGGPLLTDPIFDTLSEGTYDFHVEDSVGCPWDTTITILLNILDVEVEVDDALCYGNPTGQVRITMNDGVSPYTITLGATVIPNVTGTNLTIDSIASGNYFLRVEDDEGRRFDTTVTINEAVPINVTKSTNNPSCSEYELDGTRSNNGSISYFPSGGAGGFTFSWADTSLTTSSRTELVADTFTVTIMDANGCVLENTTILEGDETISAYLITRAILADGSLGVGRIIEWDTTVCYLSRYLMEVNYLDGDNVEWSSNPYPDIYFDYPDLIVNSDTASITARDAGQVVATVTTDNCMSWNVLNISLFDTLNASISTSGYRIGDTIYAPQGVPLSLWVEETNYSSYNWIGTGPFSSTNEPMTTLTPEEDQLVTFEGITPDGCVDRGYVFVKNQIPIDVYGVFTPNDDGYNDYWLIPNAVQYPELEVTVFDRWGQQVFYSKPYGIDMHHVFDGTSQKSGNDLPVGTYYYIIKPNDGEQGTFTGTVTIVR